MDIPSSTDRSALTPVTVSNGAGRGRVVLVCDHASNALPAELGTLGLDPDELSRHIAWDPGALPVAQAMSRLLDAPLIASGVSRLVIDCNRAPDAPDLIADISETTTIPGNAHLSAADRVQRIALAHTPFHAAIDDLLTRRLAERRETWLVSVHSFNPTYRGRRRPWQVGILHDDDERLSGPMIAALRSSADLVVGDNEPYSPADRVYYTLERHGRARGLRCAMIEIRNDEIGSGEGQANWGERLAGILAGLSAEEQAGRATTRRA